MSLGLTARGRRIAAALAAAGCLWPRVGEAQVVDTAKSDFNMQVRARGLKNPEGVALHPSSRDIYVAERGANRVVVLRNNTPAPAIESGWTVETNYPKWVISKNRPREAVERGQLQSPGALSFSTNGHLFVVEQVPWGRVLEFIPDDAGQYKKAQVVGVPWLEKPYVWEDLKAADDGRLFVAGNDSAARGGLTFGVVLVRDLEGDWWVVDYGPFMNFSGVSLSRKQDVVVIGERPEGGIVWWDAVRHLPIGTAGNLTPQSEIEAVGLLGNGAIVLAQRASTKGKDARLLSLDPTSGALKQLVEGLDSLGAICLVPETGNLLVTDPQAGLLAECSPKTPLPPGEYLIQRSLEGYEMATGFTPRSSPQFLRSFFSQAGVGLDQQTTKGSAGGEDEGEAGGGMAVSVSLRDFASKLPLVAGKVKVMQAENLEGEDKDPVTEVNFVLLFPGRMVLGGEYATPSMSYFAATRKSGKVEQTRELLSGMAMDQRVQGEGWTRLGKGGAISVPLVTCSMQKRDDGMELNLVFLGMGLYDDYYLSMMSGVDEEVGTLVVNGIKGDRRVYKTSFREVVNDGSEVKNLVVAGFDPKEKIGVGWLNIGRWPVGSYVGLGEMQSGAFQGVSEDLARLIERKQMEWRATEVGAATEGGEVPAGEPGAEPVPAPVGGGEAGAPVPAPAATP
ncbi:MAG: hypothetical protein KA248_07400 [Kiritimatiellae bacterium]|nr:hypothetical protein [Kiritimatiellia bacterium]